MQCKRHLERGMLSEDFAVLPVTSFIVMNFGWFVLSDHGPTGIDGHYLGKQSNL